MRDKYDAAHDKYCYPDSDVLINLLDIRDPGELAEAEAEFSAERYRTYDPSQLLYLTFRLHIYNSCTITFFRIYTSGPAGQET